MAKRADFRPEKVRDLPEGTPFVMISQAMLESPAWSVLGVNHRRLLDFLMIEHTANAGLENGRLKAPRNQLETFGIPRRFIGSTIFETEALGFVDVVDPGMRGNVVQGRPGLYALTFVRVVTVDDFGRTVFSEPSHRYLSITLDDAYRIIGKKPPTRILKSSSKVAKVTPNQGHIGHNPRVTIDPSTMTETAEISGSAKGSQVTQLSTSRGGGVELVSPDADRHAAAASASTSSQGRDDSPEPAPSPVQPTAIGGSATSADLYPDGIKYDWARDLAMQGDLFPDLPVDDMTPLQVAQRVAQEAARNIMVKRRIGYALGGKSAKSAVTNLMLWGRGDRRGRPLNANVVAAARAVLAELDVERRAAA